MNNRNGCIDYRTDNMVNQNKSLKKFQKPKGLGVRHIQIALLFIGLMIAFALRVNISLGIVAMVDNSSNPEFEQFDWNESIRGIILSSFYWGYIVSPFPVGLLAQKFGPKNILIISSTISALLTITLPLISTFSWGYVCASRVLLGFFQGFFYPCVHTLLAKWVHPSEQGILSAITYAAPSAGTLIMLSVSGVIALSAIGWPGIFYISGIFSAIWSIIWAFCGSNSPAENKMIMKEEREFIQSGSGNYVHRSFSTPWKHIFTSKPFWALLIAYCTETWGFFTLLSVTPTYMDGVLHLNIESNALFSALPYLVLLFMVVFYSILSDYLINHKYISVEVGRKLFNTIGMWTPAICLIGLGFVTSEHAMWAIALLTILMGVNGGVNVGYMINHIDLSPNFAGILMGITDSIGAIMSLLGPLFVGFVVYDMTNPELWKLFFFFTSGFFFIGNLIFIIFGTATVQHWNEVDNVQKTNNFQ